MAKEGLKKWFSRNGGKGWIDCRTGKPCGRKSAKKGKSKRPYPACRPTKAQCNSSMRKKKACKNLLEERKEKWQKVERNHVSLLKVKDLQSALRVSAVPSVRRVRQKMAVIAFAMELRKGMLIVQDQLASRSARTHHVLMLFPVRSGSVVVRSR